MSWKRIKSGVSVNDTELDKNVKNNEGIKDKGVRPIEACPYNNSPCVDACHHQLGWSVKGRVAMHFVWSPFQAAMCSLGRWQCTHCVTDINVHKYMVPQLILSGVSMILAKPYRLDAFKTNIFHCFRSVKKHVWKTVQCIILRLSFHLSWLLLLISVQHNAIMFT